MNAVNVTVKTPVEWPLLPHCDPDAWWMRGPSSWVNVYDRDAGMIGVAAPDQSGAVWNARRNGVYPIYRIKITPKVKP